MISQQTIQEIQSRIDMLDVVGNFVKLKRRGTNYLGLCPFHNEKTPSFTVSPSKEIYKCFGCGKSGNAIGFVMEHEKFTYPEALKWLANRYNIEIEETESSPEYKEQQQVSDSLHILNQFAVKYFAAQLKETEEGQTNALSYLKERGFNDDIIEKFQIGYCPESGEAFTREALKQQYSGDLLKKSGLSVERNGQLYDNYRGRIIFPIHNQSGKIIGFGARVIGSSDRGPKYINTPENELYVKSKILYGSYFARHPIDKLDECFLVEGYTDVTAMHQAGIENVVASGGTSLTIDQLRLIRKYTNNLTIIYDGDSAGIKAALRGLDLAMEEGLNVQLVLIPDNEDPDSYVKKVGADEFRSFVKDHKKDFILFQLDIALSDAGNDSTKKAAVVNQMAESISKLSRAEDFTRQQDYIKRCSHLLKIDEQGLTALVQKFTREKLGKEEKKLQRENIVDQNSAAVEQQEAVIDLLFKDEMNEQAVLRSLIEFGSKPWENDKTVADYIFEEIEKDGLEELFDNKGLIQLLQSYKAITQGGSHPSEKHFLYHTDPAINQTAVSLLSEKHAISPNWEKYYKGEIFGREELYKEEVISSMTYLKLKKIKRLIVENQRDLENNPSNDDMIILLQTHKHLKELEMDLMKNIGTVIFK
ncbi:MAG: DNA primase [Chitinophagia bacterium]|nr:DNA primase [Chitinophagia bacterium]